MSDISPSVSSWCDWARDRQAEGRLDEAKTGYARALEIDPKSLPARFCLASLLLDEGDGARAASIAAQMSSDAPDSADVLWLTSRIAVARGAFDAARETLDRLLVSASLTDEQRAEALLLLGIALDELGDHSAAMTAAERGKSIQRRLWAPLASSREGEVAKLQRIRTWMAKESAPWARPAGRTVKGAAATHVFLLGFPRSGTTLLEQVLAAHPKVVSLEEAPTLAAPYEAFLSDARACATLMRIEQDEATAWAEHYWAGVVKRGLDVQGRVFVDKQPAGTLYLPLIAKLFPTARILFAVRDPRDVVLSCFRQSFQMNAMTYTFTDLPETAACYDACMGLAEEARARLPLAWNDVRHEALVEQFDSQVARIVAFLGLNPEPAMADFARTAQTRTIRTPSAPQVRAGLNRRGLGRWTAYREALAPVLPVLAPWVERYGYTP